MEIKTRFKIGDRVTDNKGTYLIEEIYCRQNIKGEITIEYSVINAHTRCFIEEKDLKEC